MRATRNAWVFTLWVLAGLLGVHAATAYKPTCRSSTGAIVQCTGTLDTTQAPTAIAASTLTGTIAIGRIPTGTTSSTVTIGNDARLAPTPSGAGKVLYDTGSAYAAAAAGTSTQVLFGGTAPAFSAAPIGVAQTGFFGSTTTSTTYYFTGLAAAPITSGERVFYQAPRAVTVKNCSCYVGFAGANPAAVTCTGRLWNGTTWADTATACTITAPAYRCVDTTHSHTMAAQDLLAAKVVTNGSVTLNAATEAAWSCEVYAQ